MPNHKFYVGQLDDAISYIEDQLDSIRFNENVTHPDVQENLEHALEALNKASEHVRRATVYIP